MKTTHKLTHKGELIFKGSENECYMKLQRSQSQSADWAIKYEGWKVEPIILFFTEGSAQRRELRKMWNDSKTDWNEYLLNYDSKAVKVADAMKISLIELSRKCDLIEIFKMYDEFYTMYEYHRNPTTGEINFGHGATHYKNFSYSLSHKPNGNLKKWLVCPIDGLRYYR